jgi:nucleoid-associated protein YgaU
MGLISFVKNVGASIFGGSEAKAAPADQLHKELEKHGLDASGVKIEVDGDKVNVSGTTASTEQAEKIAIALGNTVGVQTVENNIAAAKRAPESKFYAVKSGDTLWAIAEVQYGKGNGAKYDIIFQANRPMLTHPDKIYPGQVLRIPPLP